jgi:hypothetical protein
MYDIARISELQVIINEPSQNAQEISQHQHTLFWLVKFLPDIQPAYKKVYVSALCCLLLGLQIEIGPPFRMFL